MSKSKLKATILVANGKGGMVPVQDNRFEPTNEWPLQFEVPKEQSDTWLEYLSAECIRREWSRSGISQISSRENSGSININIGSTEKPQLSIVWERKRGGGLTVRARSTGAPELPSTETELFFQQVNERCRTGAREHLYQRWHLEYYGLPWRGEFWLDDTLRLGPPPIQYERALFGPRVIMVDLMVSCIGRGDLLWVRDQQLMELSAFLSVILGTAIHITENGREAWTWAESSADCTVRNIGYSNSEYLQEMPSRGIHRSATVRQVSRPDFADHAYEDQMLGEVTLPSDISELWASYKSLPSERRRQFLQAVSKWQEALSLFRNHDTLSVALMVVACESLKPQDPEFRNHNIYNVVEALLGKSSVGRLQVDWFRAQDVRNAHLHAGEFRGTEFVQAAINSSYQDPTFDEARRALAPITREAIIAWLRLGGEFVMPPLVQKKKSTNRRVKEYAWLLIFLAAILGLILGWSIRHLTG